MFAGAFFRDPILILNLASALAVDVLGID